MKIIEFKLTTSEIMDCTKNWHPKSYEQAILYYCREVKGLVCTGVLNLVPLGIITQYEDLKDNSYIIKQIIV